MGRASSTLRRIYMNSSRTPERLFRSCPPRDDYDTPPPDGRFTVRKPTCAYTLQRPRWLQDAIAEIEEKFSRARFVVSAQGMLAADRPENWEVQCNQCEEYAVSQ